MKRLFGDRITEAGRDAIRDLIDQVAQQMNQIMKNQGEDSQHRLILASISFLMEDYERALPFAQSFVAACKTKLQPPDSELRCGFGLLANIFMALEQPEEAQSAIKEVAQVAKQQSGASRLEDPLFDGLILLAETYQQSDDPASVRRTFLFYLMALSWCVTVSERDSPVFNKYVSRLRPVFENFGFSEHRWAWLVRRADHIDNHFVGLVSVLIEEGMLPSKLTMKRSSQSVAEGDVRLRGYEISGFKEEHWQSDEGFSKAFPVSVAEGELSLRVERLLAEGCRCLETTGELGTVFLIFSPHRAGRKISAFGSTTWSDVEEAVHRKAVADTIAAHGADSAMMLAWVNLPHREEADSEEVATEAVMVVARDAKSYFRGLQPARKVDGHYVFDEPVISVTTDNWFSEFTFPVEPAAKAQPEEPGRASAPVME